jgi:preprotein translocase SecE subunit
MIFFDNFTIAPYVYLALHGTYGLLWLLKEKIFPDPYFKEKINFLTSVTGFIFLGSYWVAPYILISSQKSVPNIVIAASVSINIIGVFLHFASDAQKYFSLKLKKDLIKEGFFENIRNTNYLGEVRTELKRVNWPSYSTLSSFTIVTVVTIAFFTFFIFGMDFSFKNTLINLLSFGE